MLLILGIFEGDASLALELLRWIEQLGPLKAHDFVLVSDVGTDWKIPYEIREIGDRVFRKADLVSTETSVDGWIKGSCALWRLASEIAEQREEPWFWLEADAWPLKAGWLDAIAEDYAMCGKPFMGRVIDSNDPVFPGKHMEGVAVYPANAFAQISHVWNPRISWVITGREVFLENCFNTKLIDQRWGSMNSPFRFAETKTDNRTLTLADLEPEAAIFHRVKDDSLINLLRRKLFPPKSISFVTVFPFCEHDSRLMLNNLLWMAHLHGKKQAACVLHHDQGVSPAMQKQIYDAASAVFAQVYASRYTCKAVGWPNAPNNAFAAAARYMQGLGKPWLFFEPDCVAIKADWLEQLSEEYTHCGHPFLGPYIHGITPPHGHLNGTSIYPPNAARVLVNGMAASSLAFDTEMAKDMIHICHRTNLIQHCREQPEFKTREDVARWIPASTVLYHPDKHGTLVNLL
jgi:hypothetical protein